MEKAVAKASELPSGSAMRDDKSAERESVYDLSPAATKLTDRPRLAPAADSGPSAPGQPPHPILKLQQTIGNQAVGRLLASQLVQAKPVFARNGDGAEREADRIGEGVARAFHTALPLERKPVIERPATIQRQAKDTSPGKPDAPSPAPPAMMATVKLDSAHPADEGLTRHLLADDAAIGIDAGQKRKSVFLKELRTELCATAEQILQPVGRSAKACPWIDYWLGYYESQDAIHVERAILKYAPESSGANSADDYLAPIVNRVARAIGVWAFTGRITGVPQDIQAGAAAGTPTPAATPPDESKRQEASRPDEVRLKGREGESHGASSGKEVRAQLGAGQPLAGEVKGRMESSIGADFSGVRVHTGFQAAQVSSDLHARAFTAGNDVAFGAGEYQPGTLVGDALIAHELAHVVQQGEAPQTAPAHEQALENDADVSAAGAVVSLWTGIGNGARDVARNAMPRLRSGLRLQRCGDPAGLTGDQRREIWEKAIANQFEGLMSKQNAKILPELQAFVDKSREILQDAARQGLLPQEIYNLWDAARVAIIPLVPSAKAGSKDDKNEGMRTAGAANIQAFYDKFRDLVSSQDKFSHKEMRGKFASVKIFDNPYFSPRQYYDFTDRLKKATSGSDWLDVFDDFKSASHKLFVYVADQLRAQALTREPADLMAARDKIKATIKTLGPSLSAGKASADDVKNTADRLEDFVVNLRAAVAPLDHEAHTPTRKGGMGSTTYTASHFSEASAYELRAAIRAARKDPSQWNTVFERFEGAAAAVDTYLKDPKRTGYSEQADQLLQVGGISAEVDDVLRNHPDAIKAPALFYPRDEADYVKNQSFEPASAIPLYFYIYKDGSDWKMVDVTTPLRVKVNTADSLPNGQPDHQELLSKLNTALRFPKGMLFVKMPDGVTWQKETTARWTVSQWFTYIGIGLATIALGLATFGAGTAATVFFFGASVAGGIAAAADIYEKQQQGLLTVKDVIIDVAQIVSEIAGVTSLTAGRIIQVSKVVELRTLKVFVTAAKIKVASNAVGLIAMDLKVMDEMDAIDKAGGSDADRALAKERLASSALTATTMAILSMQGDIADFQGKNLYLDKDFVGKTVARPLRPDAHLFEQASKKIGSSTDLEALLARKDLPEDLLNRIRGEVDFAMDAGKIPKDRLNGLVGKLRNAPDATKAAEALAELRYVNRITYAGELARDSGVITGARAGAEQTLAGGRKVKIDPVPEADALYVGKDKKVHLDEVKNTTNALRQKLDEKPQQLANMAKWRGGAADREIGVAIESQEGWTDVFALAPGQKRAVLKVFIEEKIPLRIGPFKMDVAKMEELWAATEKKARAMSMWPPKKEFFDNMPTLSDAEKFLGIKF